MLYDNELETIDVLAIHYLEYVFTYKNLFLDLEFKTTKTSRYLYYVAKDCYLVASKNCSEVGGGLFAKFRNWQAIIENEESVKEWESLLTLRLGNPLGEWYRSSYLKSNIWYLLRDFLLPDYCYICKTKAECLHHSVYDDFVLRGLDISYLIPLCNSCHQEIEFDETGHKMSVFQAAFRLFILSEKKDQK